jgi:hypothetical protein
MWGNYWTSPTSLDQTPRLFCSSIIVLCISLLNELPPELVTRLEPALGKIEESLLGSKDIPLLYVAAASAAVLSVRGAKLGSRVRSRIRRLAWSARANLADLGVYFYDFEYRGEAGGTAFGRDYFIVPSEILVGIAGLQFWAPAALRQRAEAAAKALLLNIDTNQGVYRSDPEQRISSKNQAWAALLLRMSIEQRNTGSGAARTWYWLRRERKGNWFTELAFPLTSLCVITAEIVIFRGLGSLVDVLTGIGGVIIGGLYGSTFLRKWFPGR